jgi:insertion element IS1 protein InsB
MRAWCLSVPLSGSNNLVKQGKTSNGTQKWQCNGCKKYFRLDYRYRAWQAGIKDKIIEITLNNSGVRDIGRVLKISKDTVCSVSKKTTKINPYFLTANELYKFRQLEIEIRFSGETDEFWSFVQNKGNQRWTWYAIERRSGIILAWHNGKRQDKDFLILWELLKVFPISIYHTDAWGSYSKYIPSGGHRIGKDKTWKIERKNLNFRTHLKRLNRKTICFSKNEQILDNVIGMYIEKYYYKTGTFGNNSS